MRSLRRYLKSLLFPSRPSVPTSLPRMRPQLEALETRLVPYNLSGNAWPHPELITLSFVPDGTNLGGATSNLFATLNAKWSTATWENQVLKAAQTWAQQTNINFALVNDSGADSGSGAYQQGDPTMGDIRIGGYAYSSNTIASAILPPPVNNYSIAGDITLNTAQSWSIGGVGGYDLFTAVSHELGHSLGLLHSTQTSADLYGYYNTVKTSLKTDDINGIRAIYSNGAARSYDQFGGTNNSFATAANLSGQIDPTALTALVTGLDVTNAGQADYFTFTAPTGTTGNLAVTIQSSGLSLLAPTLTVFNASQTQVGYVSGAGQYGTTLSMNLTGVTAGQQYYVKVTGADTTAFGTGKYAMTLNFGSSPTPTVPLPNTQTLNGTPISGSGGVGLMVGRSNPDGSQNGNNHSDNLTVMDFTSIQHGGGCTCALCTSAASARLARDVVRIEMAEQMVNGATGSIFALSSSNTAFEQSLRDVQAAFSTAPLAVRTAAVAPAVAQPFTPNTESRLESEPNGPPTGIERKLTPPQSSSGIPSDGRPAASVDSDLGAANGLARTETVAWSQAAGAYFSQELVEANAGEGEPLLDRAENMAGEAPEVVTAAALAVLFAANTRKADWPPRMPSRGRSPRHGLLEASAEPEG